MIELQDITKVYSGVTVLDVPHLSLHPGESFGLVGNNGAGKTTLFSIVLDLILPESGRVLTNGVNVRKTEEWKSYTGAYLDETFVIDFLLPDEYFEFIGRINGLTDVQMKDFVGRFAEFFNGEVFGGKKLIRELSKGNQKKVGIAAALMGNPAVIVLDEPFPHLDPTSVIRLKALLRAQAQESEPTMLISSHDLTHITEVCDRIAILEKGRIVRDMETNEQTLKELQRYFGAEH